MVDKPEIRDVGRAVRRRRSAHRAGVVRLHRGRRRRACTRSSATRARTRRSRCSTTTPGVADGLPRGRADRASAVRARRPRSRPTYWLYHELWRLLTEPRPRARGCARSCGGTDAIFDRGRPAAVPHGAPRADPVAAAAATCAAGGTWMRIDFNIGKLVEPAGTERGRCASLHLVGSRGRASSSPTSPGCTPPDCLRATADPARYDVRPSPTSRPAACGASRRTSRRARSRRRRAADRCAEAVQRLDRPRARRDGPADVLPARA